LFCCRAAAFKKRKPENQNGPGSVYVPWLFGSSGDDAGLKENKEEMAVSRLFIIIHIIKGWEIKK
jgi:hypothetical protein